MEMLWGAFDKREGLLSKGPLHVILPFVEGLRKHFSREVEVRPIGDFDFDFGDNDEEDELDPDRPFRMDEYGYDYRQLKVMY